MWNTFFELTLSNRFDVFASDDDAGEPVEPIPRSKPKQQQKQAKVKPTTSDPTVAALTSQKKPTKVNATKGGGKRSHRSTGGPGAKDLHPDKLAEDKSKQRDSKQDIRHPENQKTGGVYGAGASQEKAKVPPGTGSNYKAGTLAPGDSGGNDDKSRRTRAAKWEHAANEMTLDEWKAQKAAVSLKPQHNLRKAGEGDDPDRWEEMVPLGRKSVQGGEAGSAPEAETRSSDTQKAAAGGKGGKQVLGIEFHFAEPLPGWLGRGQGMGRGGPGEWRCQFPGETGRSSVTGGVPGGMEQPQRDNFRCHNRPPFAGGRDGPDRSYGGGMNKNSWRNPRGPPAPKVDDEQDFPTLR